MAAIDATRYAHRQAPNWPMVLLALCAVMATLSLAQGIVDLVIPTLQNEEPFGFLFGAANAFGPNFLIVYIFIHNFGLACLVPGVGFLAAFYEKKTVNRGVIGILLAGAVILSLLIALQYLIQAKERFDLSIAIPIYVGEALTVLAMSIASAMELRGFVPTRRYQWALVTPFRRLALVLATTAAVLALLATLETYVLYQA